MIMASTFRKFLIRAALGALIHANHSSSQSQDAAQSSSDCYPNCRLEGVEVCATLYGWIPRSAAQGYAMHSTGSTEATMTVMTIVNTVLDETSVTTITPRPTDRGELYNDDGTMMVIVSWSSSRSGETTTSTMTFPDRFIFWPDHYAWSGALLTTETPGGPTRCITVDSSSRSTVSITSKLQPDPSPSTLTGDDLRGHNYMPVKYGEFCDDDDWHYWAFSEFFPEQAAITSCQIGAGPHLGGYLETYWSTIETTTYIGEDGSVHTSTVIPTESDDPGATTYTGDDPVATTYTRDDGQVDTITVTRGTTVVIVTSKDGAQPSETATTTSSGTGRSVACRRPEELFILASILGFWLLNI
ncbi:hypothetical protein V8F33_001546 [Rhypophila sp. PSN 637]